MSLFLRKATFEDSEILYNWRNEIKTRLNSFNMEPIRFEDHEIWFKKMMNDTKRIQYIMMYNEDLVGQVRLYIEDDIAEISYGIGEKFQGNGFGNKIIELLLEKKEEDFPQVKKLIAEVKCENIPSKKVFIKNGFVETVLKLEKEI